MRPSVASRPTEAAHRSFADDVGYYLSLTPRQLPSKYFYDDLGSALFEAICRLPWYDIARTERKMLGDGAQEIFGRLAPVSTVVELGPGSGEKLAALMAGCSRQRVTVHLIDVSPTALDRAVGVLGANPDLTIVTHLATYEEGLAEVERSTRLDGRVLTVFLGSNIGNFDPPGVDAFLRNVRAAFGGRGALLMGTDLVKPVDELLLAYDDPLGVTAAFNRNLLVRVNRELGADFDVERFAHRAVWNAGESRIEMHLVSGRRQRVRVPASGLEIEFEAGETIWTESSYKYRAEELGPMLERAGFRVASRWVEIGFALTLAEGC
jgi:dimethylhistidine N-methyltransferase